MFGFGKKKPKTKCTLEIELTKDTWELGENIVGNVILRKDAPVTVDSVRIRLTGQEWYKVTDSYDVPENKRSKSKVIFDTQWIIVSTLAKNKEPAGETRYPIKLKVPTDLAPSTNIPEIAKIHYDIQSEASYSGTVLTANKEVCVVKAQLNESVTAFVDKKTFFMKDPITLRCLPDKREYKPHDQIVLDLSVDNRSPKEITRIFIRLVTKSKYGSNKETKNIINHEITRPKLPILSGQKYEEMITLEEIPEGTPASSNSTNVKVEYFLSITTEFFSGGEWETKMPFFILGVPAVNHESLGKGYVQQNDGVATNPEVLVMDTNNNNNNIIDNNNNNNNTNTNINNNNSPVLSSQSNIEPYFSPANHVPIKFDFTDREMPLLRGGFPYGHPAYYGATLIYKPSPISLFVPKKNDQQQQQHPDFPPVNPEIYT